MPKLALVALTFLALVGCHSQPPPTPFPELPAVTLERVKLSTAVQGRRGLWVPEKTLLTRAGIRGVFVERAGHARFQMVKAGQHRDNYIQILSGLYGDETLLAGALERVHDGSPLMPNRQTRQ